MPLPVYLINFRQSSVPFYADLLHHDIHREGSITCTGPPTLASTSRISSECALIAHCCVLAQFLGKPTEYKQIPVLLHLISVPIVHSLDYMCTLSKIRVNT